MKHYFYYPFHYIVLFFYLIFFFMFSMFFVLGIPFAFEKLGIPPRLAMFLFWLSLIGSFINIPLTRIKSDVPISPKGSVNFWGIRYSIPHTPHQTTLLAINLGGAIVPIFLSALIFASMAMNGSYILIIKGIIGIAIVSVISYIFAKPVKGMGIALPAFLPPIVAAITAIFISPQDPVPIAYVAGTMGTLIGADILHLRDIGKLGAPVASIGGAGTFDGVFLSGIIAVLLI